MEGLLKGSFGAACSASDSPPWPVNAPIPGVQEGLGEAPAALGQESLARLGWCSLCMLEMGGGGSVPRVGHQPLPSEPPTPLTKLEI